MRDGVLHDLYKVRVLGLRVDPGLISAWAVTGSESFAEPFSMASTASSTVMIFVVLAG